MLPARDFLPLAIPAGWDYTSLWTNFRPLRRQKERLYEQDHSRRFPSMMCADALNLGADAVKLTEAGVQYFHYDIMDGDFVPNFMLGPDVIKAVRKVSAVPADIHLMVKNPERHLHLFDLKPGDMVSVHQESTIHLQRTLAAIRAAGAQAAVALNPATPLCMTEDVLPDLDMVVVMTVKPGFAGQKLVPATLGKITRLRRMLDENGYDNVRIEVDGNVSL